MQDLKQDLAETIDSAKDALHEIENETTRLACQEVVRLTLKNIIQRIDDELLQMEEKQTVDFARNYVCECLSVAFSGDIIEDKEAEQFYTETFEK